MLLPYHHTGIKPAQPELDPHNPLNRRRVSWPLLMGGPGRFKALTLVPGLGDMSAVPAGFYSAAGVQASPYGAEFDDGSTMDALTIADPAAFLQKNTFTARVRVRAQVYTNELTIFGSGGNNPSGTWRIGLNNTTVLLRQVSSAGNNRTSTFTFDADKSTREPYDLIVRRLPAANDELWTHAGQASGGSNWGDLLMGSWAGYIGDSATATRPADGIIEICDFWDRILSVREMRQIFIDPMAGIVTPRYVPVKAPAAGGGGLAVPVALHSYRRRRAA